MWTYYILGYVLKHWAYFANYLLYIFDSPFQPSEIFLSTRCIVATRPVNNIELHLQQNLFIFYSKYETA